jgi:hypothetical protein
MILLTHEQKRKMVYTKEEEELVNVAFDAVLEDISET